MPKTLPHAWIVLLACLWTVGDPVCAKGQDEAASSRRAAASVAEPIPPEHHRWGRFPLGAWRRVRIVEQTLDDGRITGQSEIVRVEHLRDVGPQQYTLEQQVTIEIAGERVPSAPTTITLLLATDDPGSIQSVSEDPTEVVPLDGRDVEARVLLVETVGEAYTIRTRLSYSAAEPPYVLRSISEAVVPASQESVWQRTRKVLARELPFALQDDQVQATFWEEQHVSTKGMRHSILASAEEIPGGVVARWTKETDTRGSPIRREIETLLQWGVKAE